MDVNCYDDRPNSMRAGGIGRFMRAEHLLFPGNEWALLERPWSRYGPAFPACGSAPAAPDPRGIGGGPKLDRFCRGARGDLSYLSSIIRVFSVQPT